MLSESQNIEYKESWRDEYLKWICGFANAQGGRIFIGVNDEKQVIGLPDAKKLMEDIPKYAKVLKFATGELLLSGLMEGDFEDIVEVCQQNGLEFVSKKQRNECQRFQRDQLGCFCL